MFSVSWLGCLVNELFSAANLYVLAFDLPCFEQINLHGLVTKALSVWQGLDIGHSLFPSFLRAAFMDGLCIRAVLGIENGPGMNSILEEGSSPVGRESRKQIFIEPVVIEVTNELEVTNETESLKMSSWKKNQ